MKVIQIAHSSLSDFSEDLDPRFYEEEWHVKVSKRIMDFSDEHEVECWRPERSFTETYSRIGEKGITYRIFPSTYLGDLQTYSFEFSCPLLRRLRKEAGRGDVLFHFHGFYYFHTYLMLTLMKERDNSPVVVQSHGGRPALAQLKKSAHPLRYFFLLEKLFQKIAFKYIDHFFCIHEEEREELSRSHNGTTTIQPMGVDFDKYIPEKKSKAREQLGLDSEAPLVHYLGRLHGGKGIDFLLKAVQELKERGQRVGVNIAGEGPEKENLQKLSKELGIEDQVDFVGFIDESYKVPFYNAADVFVFPSPYEPYGIVPIEALACKTPLVATDTGIVSQVAEHFKGGSIVVPPTDPSAIASGVKKILEEKNPERRIDRNSGRKHHGWEEKIKNTLRVYESLEEKYW